MLYKSRRERVPTALLLRLLAILLLGLLEGEPPMLLLLHGDAPLGIGNFSAAKGVDLVLLKAGQLYCPRSPATFKTCAGEGGGADGMV